MTPLTDRRQSDCTQYPQIHRIRKLECYEARHHLVSLIHTEYITHLSILLKTYMIFILLQFEAESRIPFPVTEYGADAERREGDLSIYAHLSFPFQYKMTRLVQACDQLSPVENHLIARSNQIVIDLCSFFISCLRHLRSQLRMKCYLVQGSNGMNHLNTWQSPDSREQPAFVGKKRKHKRVQQLSTKLYEGKSLEKKYKLHYKIETKHKKVVVREIRKVYRVLC